MRHISRAMLRTGMGLAITAAIAMGGTAAASAATSIPATHSFPGPGCSPWALERWNLNGGNEVEAVYQHSTYTYSVTFKQYGSCLSGTLTDPTFPPSGTTGPIHGTIYKNYVTFSFTYPNTGTQGTRTFTGTISRRGAVSGTWSETGSEDGTGTWSLATKASFACPWAWAWWDQRSACPVFPHQYYR